jgi:hypothetical protein
MAFQADGENSAIGILLCLGLLPGRERAYQFCACP